MDGWRTPSAHCGFSDGTLIENLREVPGFAHQGTVSYNGVISKYESTAPHRNRIGDRTRGFCDLRNTGNSWCLRWLGLGDSPLARWLRVGDYSLSNSVRGTAITWTLDTNHSVARGTVHRACSSPLDEP